MLQWGCGTQCHEKGSCKVRSVSVVVTAQVSGNPGVSVQECTKSEGTSTRHDTISVLRCGYETRYEWMGERCDEGGNEAASSGGAAVVSPVPPLGQTGSPGPTRTVRSKQRCCKIGGAEHRVCRVSG